MYTCLHTLSTAAAVLVMRGTLLHMHAHVPMRTMSVSIYAIIPHVRTLQLMLCGTKAYNVLFRSVQGTICSVTSTHVDVALPSAASQALAGTPPGTPIRVDRVLREVTTTRQLRAIGLLRDGYTGEMSPAQQMLRAVLFSLPDTPTLAATNPPWTR